VIKEVDLAKDDIVVFYVDVGNLPPARVKEYLENIKAEVAANIFGTEQKVMFVPRLREADGIRRDTDIAIIHRV